MAMDWLKVEKGTPEKPEIVAIAADLGIHPNHAFGSCFLVWSWFDTHTTNGDAPSVTETFLDACAKCDGVTSAMLKIGWLKRLKSGGFSMPHFDYHNGKSSKRRSLTQRRTSHWRARSARRKCDARSVTLSNSNSNSISSSCISSPEEGGVGGEVAAEKPARKPREPDPIWDTVVALWFASGVPTSQRARVGKVVRDLKELHATPEQVRERHAIATREWQDVRTFTPEAVVKHWDSLNGSAKPKDEPGRVRTGRSYTAARIARDMGATNDEIQHALKTGELPKREKPT